MCVCLFVCSLAVNAKTMGRIDARCSGIIKNDSKSVLYLRFLVFSSRLTAIFYVSPGSICQLSVGNVDDIRSAFVETLTSPKCRRRRTLAEKLAKGRLLC